MTPNKAAFLDKHPETTAETARLYWTELLQEFVTTHGRAPQYKSSDDDERSLARAVGGYRISMPELPKAEPAPVDPEHEASVQWWNQLEFYMAIAGTEEEFLDANASTRKWVAGQRMEAGAGNLTKPQILALEGLDQVLNLRRFHAEYEESKARQEAEARYLKAWHAKCRNLIWWCMVNNSLPALNGGKKERALALWLRSERRAHRNGLLNGEQAAALSAVRSPGAARNADHEKAA